ncbi:SCP-like protein [Oesophagostomum dentatum]|uniref:SCP-like protein n=1 Tax=Oesophagostomum dentatum TaxID=61180 RepID=A0A0B1T7C6_OESDE|nr:SCP-like protein [Oesophagostomum dentatum]
MAVFSIAAILFAAVWLPHSQEQSTAAPGTTTVVPGTSAPGSTTAVPSTSAPGSTTAAPGSTTAVPGTTTAAPTVSTAAPSSTTVAPVTSTGAPGTSTSVPRTSTVAPSSSSTRPAGSTAAPGGTTRRPWPRPNCDNTMLTNTQRGIFLDMHNNYRGSLARGQGEVNRNWGIAPPAALMYRMQYDCDAESYAIQAVSNCRTTPLPEDAIGTHKQNIHVLRTTQTTPEGAMQNVCFSPRKFLLVLGSLMLMQGAGDMVESIGKLRWSKMAWWDNIRVGCATQNCGTYYVTSCMYNPGGNYVNSYVYRVGAVCSECSPTNCDIWGLCRW